MSLKRITAVLIILCTAIAFAGCSSTPSAPALTPGSVTSGGNAGPASSGGNLVPTPTDTVPDYDMVKVDVGEKDYLGVIPVIFQGGLGQIHVQKIEVFLYRDDGQQKSATIAANKGAEATLQGTRQTDRVVVYVTLNGVRYKTNDVLSPYRTR